MLLTVGSPLQALVKPLDPNRCESCYGAETKDGQ